MSDMGEYWNDVKAARQEKRASNRDDSAAMLRDAGISFAAKNGAAHLIVSDNGHTIDFWPGTGRWIMRGSTQRHFGVRKLIKLLRPNAEIQRRRSRPLESLVGQQLPEDEA